MTHNARLIFLGLLTYHGDTKPELNDGEVLLLAASDLAGLAAALLSDNPSRVEDYKKLASQWLAAGSVVDSMNPELMKGFS